MFDNELRNTSLCVHDRVRYGNHDHHLVIIIVVAVVVGVVEQPTRKQTNKPFGSRTCGMIFKTQTSNRQCNICIELVVLDGREEGVSF